MKGTTDKKRRYGGLERAIVDEENDVVWTVPVEAHAGGGARGRPDCAPDWKGIVVKQGRRITRLWSSREWTVWRLNPDTFYVQQNDHDFVISGCKINDKEQVEGRDGKHVRKFRLVDDDGRRFWGLPALDTEAAATESRVAGR